MRRILLAFVLAALPSLASAQLIRYYPPGGGGGLPASGGSITGEIEAGTSCADGSVPYSFTSDTNAGVCLEAANDVRLQMAPDGASSAYFRAFGSGTQSLFKDAASNASYLFVGDNTLHFVADGTDVLFLNASTGTGFISANGATPAVARTITAGTGISVANGAGTAGNPTVSIDTAVTPQFSSGTGDVSATGTIGTWYCETDVDQCFTYPDTDAEHYVLSVPVASLAQGDIFYLDSNASVARLGAGTSGQFLQTQGAAANPQWATSTSFDPLDVETVWFREEFGLGSNATSRQIATHGWGVAGLGTSGACTVSIGVFPNLGLHTCATNALSGDGLLLIAGVTALEPLGALGSNANWDSYFIFALSSTASIEARIGYAGDYAANPAADGYWLRYDTGLSDTNFQLCTYVSVTESCQDTGVAADTAFHKVRIRSTVSGTIRMTLDGGTEYTFCAAACNVTATISTTPMLPWFAVGTLTTAAKGLTADFWAFSATVNR